jgi:hypothetical protein
MLIGGEEEAEVLSAAALAAPSAVWMEIGSRVENGDWRIEMMLRKWFLPSVPASIVAEWVGWSTERARVVAALADPSTEEPTATVRFLLDRFGDIDDVSGALAGAFMSGGSTGSLSAWIGGQIAQLQRWAAGPEETEGLKRWAREMIERLRVARDAALEREAERPL